MNNEHQQIVNCDQELRGLAVQERKLKGKPKETTLSGQIFIVTRGSENIKLGLVEVQILERQSVLAFIQKKQATINSEIKSKTEELEIAKSEYEAAQAACKATDCENLQIKYETLKAEADTDFEITLSHHKEIDSLADEMKAAARTAKTAGDLRGIYYEIAEQKRIAMLKAIDSNTEWRKTSTFTEEKWKERDRLQKVLTDLQPLLEKLAATKEKLQKCVFSLDTASHPKAIEFLGDFTPPVVNKTLTDADGKFSISYPREKDFSLFAKAEREFGDKKESYYWLINAPSGADTAQILLSNNNLVFIDPDNYFKIKPLPEAISKTGSGSE